MKIVVVEDYGPLRRMLHSRLRRYGYVVLEEGNPEDWCAPDVGAVILDLHLGNSQDGMEILRDIRKTCPELPVIVTTGSGDEDRKSEALRLGAVWVAKPYTVDELLEKLPPT